MNKLRLLPLKKLYAARLFTCYLFFLFTASFSQNKTLIDSIFKGGDIIKVPQIYFVDGRGYGNDSALKLISVFLNSHKNLKVEISSHSDSRGKALRNSELTYRRAQYIREDLITRFNVDSTQITSKGYGSTRLLINETEINKAKTPQEKEALHQKNLRIELKVLEVK